MSEKAEISVNSIQYWAPGGEKLEGPKMLTAEDTIEAIKGRGYERMMLKQGNTYKDASTCIVMPTRGMIHHRVVDVLTRLLSPQNQPRVILIVKGMEVADAYNEAIKALLADPVAKNFKYLFTLEDDILPPLNVHMKLLKAIEDTGFAAIQALYFQKNEWGFPMVLGDPRAPGWNAIPQDCREAILKGQVQEVQAVAQGATLFRMSLFKELEYPWFKTWGIDTENGRTGSMSQDCYFSKRVRERGYRFGVDCSTSCGHIDTNTGEIW